MALAGDPRGYYRALGVERTASAADIRAAFRERAKDLHPDRPGGGDREAFRRLVEAYEALRDPHERLRYDASAREAGQPQRERQGAEAAAAMPSGEGGAAAYLRRLAFGMSERGLSMVAGAIMLVIAAALLGWWRTPLRDEADHSAAAEMAAPPVSATPQPRLILTRAIRFPVGVGDLDAATRAHLAAAASELRHAIAGLPPDSAWLVAVYGGSERAADAGGLLVDAWELALLRVGISAQFLVGQGIPAERISVRFHAGATVAPDDAAPPDGVEVALWCCRSAPAGP